MRISKFDSAVTCACLALLGFFAWHAWEGPRGFHFNEKLKSQSAQLTDDLAAIQKRRTTFEGRVALLRPESVDPDMLDEMARQTLDVARPNELIVLDSP
jgi:cell division protein FtsB